MIGTTYFILIVTSLLFTVALSEDWIECTTDKFVVKGKNNESDIVYKASLNISYDRSNLALYEYSGFDDVNLLLQNSTITFSVYEALKNDDLVSENQVTYGDLDTIITGAAHRLPGDYIEDCDIYIVKNYSETDEVSRQLKIELFDQAESCLRKELCENLGLISLSDFSNGVSYPYEFGPLSIAKDSDGNRIATTEESTCKSDDPEFEQQYSMLNATQDTINTLVDMMISKMTKKLKDRHEEKVKISDMSTTFSFIGSTDFRAMDGTFEDITVIGRNGDISLSHDGMKFVLSCTFGLPEGYIKYKQYQLSTFFGMYEGEMNATIHDVHLVAEVLLDYDAKPCQVKLRDVHVAHLGEVEFSLSGLGSLSDALSSIISWSSAFFHEEITRALETKFSKFIVAKLGEYDCDELLR